MLRLGLTGGIGAGKSTVADILSGLGATVIDTDQVSRGLTAPGGLAMPTIEQEFGPQAVSEDGSLDRAFMRQLAFSDPHARKRLEAIMHPLIRQQVGNLASQASGLYLVFDVPLLVEAGRRWIDELDRICVIDCEVETQIQRVVARSGLSREQVEKIIQAQASREQRLAVAHDVILNGKDISNENLRHQVLVLHERWCNLET